MPNLERALQIAMEAHAGESDKGGEPYILHPIRVMLECRSEKARIVALLHDVVEDSPWTFEQLLDEGFDPEVVDGVRSVTRRSDEGFHEFCLRAAEHPLGREVKRADLCDNMDVTRLGPELSDKDQQRLARYRRAWEVLTQNGS